MQICPRVEYLLRNTHYPLMFCCVSASNMTPVSSYFSGDSTTSSLVPYLWLFGYRFRLADVSWIPPLVDGNRIPVDVHGWLFIDRRFGVRYSTADRFSGISRFPDTARVFTTGRSSSRLWTDVGVSDVSWPNTT